MLAKKWFYSPEILTKNCLSGRDFGTLFLSNHKKQDFCSEKIRESEQFADRIREDRICGPNSCPCPPNSGSKGVSIISDRNTSITRSIIVRCEFLNDRKCVYEYFQYKNNNIFRKL